MLDKGPLLLLLVLAVGCAGGSSQSGCRTPACSVSAHPRVPCSQWERDTWISDRADYLQKCAYNKIHDRQEAEREARYEYVMEYNSFP